MGKLIKITSAFALSALAFTGAPGTAPPAAATAAPVQRVAAPPSPHCTPVSALPAQERAPAQAPEPRPVASEQANPAYEALDTPRRMIPGDQYPVPVTVTNTTQQPLVAGRHVLSYHWTLPNGQDATAGTRIDTDLPALAPGATATVDARVEAPTLADIGNEREQFVLRWDIYDQTTRRWLSETAGVPTLDLAVRVEHPTSDQLGLEQFYAYAGVPTGAGGNVSVNEFSGNGVWNYDVLTNPSRGLASFVRLSHNTKDTSDSYAGPGWSVTASTLNRLGTPLEFGGLLPGILGWPTTVTLVDGDGTSHVWELNKHDSTDSRKWTYDSPAGVHLYLQYLPDGDDDRRWVFTSPERTKFYFDEDGYHTATVEKNGNTMSFIYERTLLGNRNTGILQYVTDATGRRTITLDYYQRGDIFSYILNGQILTGTNLANPFIINKLRSVTDVSGRTVAFTYTERGSLGQVVDGLGDVDAKPFTFFYDENAGKLLSTVDPNGHTTRVDYFADNARKWNVRTVTDRRGKPTSLDYADADGDDGSKVTNTVVDGNGHAMTTLLDGFGRPERITDAKQRTTRLHWDEDNNVDRLVENNGATQTWRYDQKTGFPLEIRDAEANKRDGPATRLGYRTELDGHVADLTEKVTPEGRKWTFVYDNRGNLLAVTDPKGTATPGDPNDFTSRYSYDTFGQLIEQTDANGNTTTYGDYDANGFPRLITDALDCTTFFRYDDVGNVVTVTDARSKTSTYTYDLFKRPLDTRVPKDQAAGVYIVTPGPRYDRNDNVVTSTAANGAVTRVAYDEMDQQVGVYAPPDQPGGPDKLTTMAYDATGNLLSYTEPKGNATPGNPNDFTYRFVYDEVNQFLRSTDSAGNVISAEYDDVGNLVKEIDARKNKTPDTKDFTSRYVFDANHQVTETVDAAGNSVKTRYDRDGNVVASTDEEGNETLLTLDERGMQTEVRSPHSRNADGSIRYFTTRYEYDQVGNLTRTVNPRGVDTPNQGNDFVAETVYDELNRAREEILPYDPGDAEHRTPVSTIYTYDEIGNLAEISAPPSHGESTRNITKQTWYDNSWLRTATDPWDIRTAYDYTPTGQQSNRTVTSAGGGAQRVETWEYYPDGKLKKHSDGGIPVGRDVVVVDNASTTRATAKGDWRTGESEKGFQGSTFRATEDDDATFRWQASVPKDGSYEVLVRYPMGRATDATYTVEHDGGTSTAKVDQTKRAGEWVSLGRYAMSADSPRSVTLSGKANGTVAADAVQLVRDNSADADDENKVFEYRYDLNDSLVELTDSTPNTPMDTLRVAYNGVNRAEKVEELKDGSVNHTTEYRYNENDALSFVKFDGKSSLYEYDPRDLVSKVTNKKDDNDAGKVNSFTYTKRGHVERHTKSNGNTVDYTYYLDGLVQRQVEHKKNNGPLVAEHNLTYDSNSNRTRDDGRKQNADNHGETIDTDSTYTYDPRDRVRKVTKDGADGQRTEEYKHDDNGNVWDQTIDGTRTAFDYHLNRLLSATTNGQRSDYDYDAFGRLFRVSVGAQQLEKYTYDGFDRKIEHVKGEGASAKTTTYTYDPLDRQQTRKVGDKTTSFHYLGLSDQVLTEDENGTLRKAYQYSNEGELLAQVKFNDDGTEEDSVYGYNPHSDVEQVTDDQGDTKSTYGYTAYGKDDDQEFSGEDKPDQTQPDKPEENSYRFNTTRHDQSTDTYDMGFRDYSPGLNRFLTLDLYNGALSDLSMATDPWTNNRYTFGAGNPLSQVEIDGHNWFDDAADWVKDNASDLGHAALDVVGLVPVVGEAADVANAAWYTAEGDYANAALSAAAAIPFAGWGASAVKAGKYAVKGVEAVQGAAKAADAGTSTAKTASKAADAGANGAKTAPTPKPAPKAGGASSGKPSGGGGGKAGGTASTGQKASGGGSGGGRAANSGGSSATAGGGKNVMFGQARVGPNFSTKANVPSYLKGRSINDVAGDLRSGRLSPDQMHITAFEHQGKLVTENNRGLTALSKAGMRPTNVTVKQKSEMPQSVLDRLTERTPLGDTLPSNRIAVTPSQSDWTILDIVSTP